ncbi:MAG: hypothetical protein WD712_00950 [Candidatus Spechtbacterales bacterium]
MKYYKLCVSGAAETSHCSEDALKKAEELGREIVKHNSILVTGATTGTPFWAAKGAKSEGGISIGLSPAYSEKEHIDRFDLPTEYLDIIIYTGFEFSGRNLLLTRSADAVFIVCGRLGTLNEFTVAFEDNKPIGILEGTGGTADLIRELMPKLHRGSGKIVYDTDPKRLVEKVLELVKKEKVIELPTRKKEAENNKQAAEM